MASDIERSSVSEDQTVVNIRERAGRRKQKPVRRLLWLMIGRCDGWMGQARH